MAIQVFESSALPDSPTSGSGGTGGTSGTSSGANPSGTGAPTSGGRVVGSSEMMVALGALVAMAAAGVV